MYRLPPMRTSCLFSVLCPLRLGPQALPPLQATLSQEVEGLRGTRDWGLGVAVGTAGAVCWGLRYRLPRAHCLWVSRLVAEAPGAHWLWGPYLTPRGFPKGTFGCFVLTLLRFCQQIFPFAFARSPPPTVSASGVSGTSHLRADARVLVRVRPPSRPEPRSCARQEAARPFVGRGKHIGQFT